MEKRYGYPLFGTVTDDAPVVMTKYGWILGFTRDKVAIFKGIPYAGPAGGKGRFLEPVDALPWEGVKDCTKNGFYAMQNGVSIGADAGPLAAYYKGKDESSTGELETQGEDCLVLDVLTAGLDDKKRPVVFYIHGGGFATGSGTMVAAADPFCREEDVVVVGVNHRLNIFGYLYLGGLSDKYKGSGSAGMMDLVKALEWVRDNIAAFGGDPENVTIMGESGGGMKVSTLMVMPAAKGLFHKAIVESGSGPIGLNTIERSEKMTETVLQNLGLTHDNWKELLDLPEQTLLDAMKNLGPMGFNPTADNVNIPDLTDSGYRFGNAAYSAEIPLLVGASEDESGLFAPIDDSMSWEDLADRLEKNGLGAMFSPVKKELSKENVQEIVKVFRDANIKNDSPFQTFIKISSLYGVLAGGAYAHAMEREGSEAFKAPVYLYSNAYDSARPDDIRYGFAFHTCDLPLQMRIVQRDQDDWISRIYARAWAAFMRSGDPSTEKYPWPAFTTKKKETMVFDNNGMTGLSDDLYCEMREAFGL